MNYKKTGPRFSLLVRKVNTGKEIESSYVLDRMPNDNGLSLVTAKKYAREHAVRHGFPCPVFKKVLPEGGFEKHFARTHKSMKIGAECHMDFTILER